MTEFNESLYLNEMSDLVRNAKRRLANDYPQIEIYTISIWTDPNAAVSAVSVDTFEHSAEHVRETNEWAQRERDRLTAEGRAELAKLLLPTVDRNCNPADFLLRNLVTAEHKSFPGDWEHRSAGKCWELLSPTLSKVAGQARATLSDLPLHPDAELGVNGRKDWYEWRQRLRE